MHPTPAQELALRQWLAKNPDDVATAVCAEQCKRSLRTFIRRSWHVIEPGTEYLHNWHIDAISEALEAVTAGQLRRLLINMPPRYGKSNSVSVAWPSWEWTRIPEQRWMFTSYAGSLSQDASIKRRLIIRSDWYQARFPYVELTDDRDLVQEYHNTRRGTMIATSRDGTATGKGGNRIVIDDLQNPKLADSPAERLASLNYFDRTLPSRLDNKKIGAMVCVMQRLHEKDVAARCKELGWECLILPGEFKKTTVFTFRSGSTVEKKAGEYLWPEREGKVEHDALKKSMGSYAYAAQYDQEPAPADGGKFKRSWFSYWRYEGEGDDRLLRLMGRGGQADKLIPLRHCRMFGTVDLATSKRQLADYTVISIWAVTPGGDLILIDRTRERMEAPETIARCAALYAQHRLSHLAVEAVGMQLGFVQLLRDKDLAVRAVTGSPEKVTNSVTAQVRMESGQIYFPLLADWLPEWETELLNFPMGEHDDQVDTLSTAANEVFQIGGAEEPEEQRQAREEQEEAEARALLEEEYRDPDAEHWWED